MEWKVRNLDCEAAFCLSARGYQNVSKNQAETLRWVREAMWRLRYYRGDLDDVQTPGGESGDESGS